MRISATFHQRDEVPYRALDFDETPRSSAIDLNARNLLLAIGRGRREEAERLLIERLDIARRQQALCWELRTSCDLGRLWQEQGRSKEAQKLLGTIYERFTEGFETTDLNHAKALIEGHSE